MWVCRCTLHAWIFNDVCLLDISHKRWVQYFYCGCLLPTSFSCYAIKQLGFFLKHIKNASNIPLSSWCNNKKHISFLLFYLNPTLSTFPISFHSFLSFSTPFPPPSTSLSSSSFSVPFSFLFHEHPTTSAETKRRARTVSTKASLGGEVWESQQCWDHRGRIRAQPA